MTNLPGFAIHIVDILIYHMDLGRVIRQAATDLKWTKKNPSISRKYKVTTGKQ